MHIITVGMVQGDSLKQKMLYNIAFTIRSMHKICYNIKNTQGSSIKCEKRNNTI